MGITVITSSQVSAWIIPHDNIKLLMMANCSVHHVLKEKKDGELLSIVKWLSKNWHLALRNGFRFGWTFLCLQRPALIPFHALELKLIDGEGNWELCSIRQWMMPPLGSWSSAACTKAEKQAAIALRLLMDNWIIDSGNVRITIFLSKSAWRRTTKHSLFSLWQSKMVWVIVSHELCGEVSLVEVLQSLIAAERKRTFVN